jgi:purine-nucleoside phosphorylase
MLKANKAAEGMGKKLIAGNVLSSDVFYNDDNVGTNNWLRMGVLAVEMESAALYANAARAGKNALCICTISDKVFDRSQHMSAEERQTSFKDMVELALAMLAM